MAIKTAMKKNIISNKRGIFFTSIAILLSAVLVLTYGTPTSVTTKEQTPLTQAKADLANSHARDLKYGYLPQALYVATYSAFYAMAEYMQLRGNYFQGADADQKFNATLKEMIINGTMCCGLAGHTPCNSDVLADVNNPSIHEGVDQCIGKAVMRDRNLTKKLRDMENASFTAFRISTAFNKDYNNMVIQLFQDNRTGPWRLGANISVNYSIMAGDVMINSSENISTIFGIEGIPDPLYAVESPRTDENANGLADDAVYTNFFNATNLTAWNISSFYHEIEWRLYRHEPNSSSFLNRFYGRDSRSECCGVESLINPAVMDTVNGRIEKPYADWCYYGRNNRCTTAQTGALWNITCVTTTVDGTKFFNYAIDTFHATKYNITNYLTGAAPGACPETPFP